MNREAQELQLHEAEVRNILGVTGRPSVSIMQAYQWPYIPLYSPIFSSSPDIFLNLYALYSKTFNQISKMPHANSNMVKECPCGPDNFIFHVQYP